MMNHEKQNVPIGLHPLDVQTLLQVFRRLIESGATVIVIEHDLDVIRNADYVIDMGPGGGARRQDRRRGYAGTDCRLSREQDRTLYRELKGYQNGKHAET